MASKLHANGIADLVEEIGTMRPRELEAAYSR
jgi:hypothetical protein